MNRMTHAKSKLWLAGLVVCAGIPVGYAQDASKAAAPDNSGVNTRDRAKSQPTADQAKENVPDRELMRRIRKAVVDDKSLSTYAHNVKIIATHGKVTLKGPVNSEEESKTIEAKAKEVAGAENVTNQISVKADKAAH